eukprot:XP_001693854.1 predicted protein [Chlamydomonas reinhardtii]
MNTPCVCICVYGAQPPLVLQWPRHTAPGRQLLLTTHTPLSANSGSVTAAPSSSSPDPPPVSSSTSVDACALALYDSNTWPPAWRQRCKVGFSGPSNFSDGMLSSTTRSFSSAVARFGVVPGGGSGVGWRCFAYLAPHCCRATAAPTPTPTQQPGSSRAATAHPAGSSTNSRSIAPGTVNGRTVDVINRLPLLGHWCWYVGLWPAGGGGGGEVSAAVLQRDQYAVYWGDYSVKRFL